MCVRACVAACACACTCACTCVCVCACVLGSWQTTGFPSLPNGANVVTADESPHEHAKVGRLYRAFMHACARSVHVDVRAVCMCVHVHVLCACGWYLRVVVYGCLCALALAESRECVELSHCGDRHRPSQYFSWSNSLGFTIVVWD